MNFFLLTSPLSLRTSLETLRKLNIACVSHQSSFLLIFTMNLYSGMLSEKKNNQKENSV